MKATGMIHKIDELGRIVIPKKIRTSLDVKTDDPMEIYVEEDKIILKKHEERCVFCGTVGNLLDFKGKKICDGCKDELAR